MELLCTGPADLLSARIARLLSRCSFATSDSTAFWSWPPYGLLVLAFLRPSGLGLPTTFWSWPSYGLLVLAFLRSSCLWPSYGLCAFWPLCLLVLVPSGLCAFWPLRLQAFVPSGLCAYFLVLALLRPSGLGLTTTFCCFMGGYRMGSICIGYAYFPFPRFSV